jgi:bifunctional DNA-binding transcriptional regulator/antitoxin component of YhaV-PrlF toxin-antitoxin module
VELLGLKEQDELEFSLEGDRISLKKSKKKRGARDE